ncbi:MAG: DMT family transporter [Bacteroidales bacterium]|nr:DMT family transporter [Bacteroidales bacterium]
MKEKNNLTGIYILLMLSMFFWGISFVFTKVVLQYMQPLTIIFFRLLISIPFIWMIVLLFYRKHKIRFKDIKMIVLLALFEPVLYFIGETFGLQRVSPTVSALIISTIPVFTALSVFFVYKVKLLKINVLGIALSFLGVMFMVIGKNMSFLVDTTGLWLLFLSVFSAVCYSLILSKISTYIHPAWIVAIQNTSALFILFPLAMLFPSSINFNVEPLFSTISPQVELWGSLCILALFCSTLAFIFYTVAVKHIGIIRSNMFTNLIPVITAIVSFLLLNEVMTINKLFGMLVIITGVIFSQWKKTQGNGNTIKE